MSLPQFFPTPLAVTLGSKQVVTQNECQVVVCLVFANYSLYIYLHLLLFTFSLSHFVAASHLYNLINGIPDHK